MVRRRRSDDHASGGHDGGGSLRWLLTYADMITLLMAFFIMMYSMSILNLNKFKQVAMSIRSGFNGPTDAQGRSLLGTSGPITVKPALMDKESLGVPSQVVERIQTLVKENKLQKSVALRQDERGLVISVVSDKVLFEKSGAELSPAAKKLVCSIAMTIKDIPNLIRVEGHTCNLPIVSPRFPSNWELSTARAATVVRCLIDNVGFPSQRLSAAGFADSRPIAPNNDEKNRALNRRVDIVVLKAGLS
jgi:chemotaxis protein MotB